jgi:arginine repressor
MTKKAAKAGANKTELTKQYVAKHPAAGLKEIVDGLKAQGVEISRSLASKIKYGPSVTKGTAKKGRRAKKQGVRAVAEHVASERENKAEAIRQAAKSLGRKVRPRDVIAMLKEQGIEVSSAQVSTTLKSMGMRRTRRGRKGHASTLAGKPPASSTHITIDDLIAAKKLVEHLGGIEQAKTAIGALAKLN